MRNVIIFSLFCGLILWGGVVSGLGYHHLAFWPWSHQWYMFSHSSNFHYKLGAVGLINGRIHQPVSLESYFSYPANRWMTRADEVSRKPQDLKKLVAFLCGENPHFSQIQIYQARYAKVPGRIPDFRKSPELMQELLPPTSCP